MIDDLIKELHQKHLSCEEGEIMKLARGTQRHFGIAVTAVDGTSWTIGDCDHDFTLQSVTKPLVYAVALGLLGDEALDERVNVEPSREPFHAIELEEGSGRPANAMLNAGALATSGILLEKYGDRAWTQIHDAVSQAAGHQLAIDEEVFRDGLKGADRHRAMAYLMRSQGTLKADPLETVELYIRQCSILLNCRDLSTVAATLANCGINPHTEERVFELSAVRDVLSVMLTCGLYNSSGDWVFRVGIPAKSGVSGGLMGVVNRQVGIATYSPPLDAQGHSVRGMKVFPELSERCSLHILHHQNHGSNFLQDQQAD